MNTVSQNSSRTVGAYEAKTNLSKLLDLVEDGREITITRRSREVARLVPVGPSVVDHSVFARIRALRSRLTLGEGESTRDLVDAGRRI